MTDERGDFRALYEDLLDHGEDLDGCRRTLDGRTAAAAARLAELEPLRRRRAADRAPTEDEDERSWTMYALSRVSDLLLELSCPAGPVPPGFGESGGRRLDPRAVSAHTGFLAGVGLTPFRHDTSFSPFHHEIVAVVADDAAPSVTVEEVLWPGHWFGDLLFCRAGVRVRAPRHLVDPVVATTSTLYFTSRRHPRPTNDLSDGWGSNSQWSTSFALFYADTEGLHLNWGADHDIGTDGTRPGTAAPLGIVDREAEPGVDDERPVQRRRELLLHRCFVRAPLPPDHEHDWYPYDTGMRLTTSAWPLPDDAVAR